MDRRIAIPVALAAPILIGASIPYYLEGPEFGFVEAAGDKACVAGDYKLFANSSTGKLRACQNGSVSDAVGGGGGAPTTATYLVQDADGTLANEIVFGAAVSNQFVTGVTGGVVTRAQPSFSNLSDSATDGQIPNNITIDLATTATTANAGDSATAFFSSGTIEGARGGVGVALPTCSGTDKLTANGTQVSCATDQTSAGGGWTFFTFGSTTTNSTTTPTTVTGFTIPVTTSDNIRAKCSVVTDAAAATTGVQITFAGPTSTRASVERVSCSSATAIVSASISGGFGADNRTASGGTNTCIEEWDIIVNNATNGTDITAQVDSEVASSAVNVYSESYCQWMTF